MTPRCEECVALAVELLGGGRREEPALEPLRGVGELHDREPVDLRRAWRSPRASGSRGLEEACSSSPARCAPRSAGAPGSPRSGPGGRSRSTRGSRRSSSARFGTSRAPASAKARLGVGSGDVGELRVGPDLVDAPPEPFARLVPDGRGSTGRRSRRGPARRGPGSGIPRRPRPRRCRAPSASRSRPRGAEPGRRRGPARSRPRRS